MRLHNVLPEARRLSLCGEKKLLRLWDLCKSCETLPGVVVEVGVYRGGSALMVAHATWKQVYLCDTFKGAPKCYRHPLDSHTAGDWPASRADVELLFADAGDRVMILAGEYTKTFPKLNLPVAFAHIDVDLYHWTKVVLEDLWGRLVVGGIVVCDDYGAATCEGAKTAVDEFLLAVDDAEQLAGEESQIVLRKVLRSEEQGPDAAAQEAEADEAEEDSAFRRSTDGKVATCDETDERLHTD